MGWRIAKQPDGKLAVFSTNVDKFLMLDATPEEVREFWIEDAVARAKEEGVRSFERAMQRAALYPESWDECKSTIAAVHGIKEARKYVR